MRRLSLAALAALIVLGGQVRAQDPDYVLSFESGVTGVSGEEVTVTCFLDMPAAPIGLLAWSLGVCHDTALLDVVDGVIGTTVETINGGGPPDFEQINIWPNGDPSIPAGQTPGANEAIVINFLQTEVLDPGSDYEIFDVTYSLIGALGSATIEYCSTTPGATSPVSTVVTPVGGSSVTPTQVPDAIQILDVLPPELSMSSVTAGPLDPVTAITASVSLEHVDHSVYGFSFGVAHDGAVATLDAITIGADLTADFFSVDIDPANGTGGIVGCVIDLSGVPPLGSLPPTAIPEEIALFDYSIAAGAGDGDMTSLSFDGTLIAETGAPAVEVMVVTGAEEWFVPLTTDGSITVEGPPPGTPFIRGDVNQDGAIDISDPVSLLNYMFAGGATPACLKSTDVNDDGGTDVADASYALNFMFAGGPAIPAPDEAGGCGLDPTPDTITCDSFTCP